MEKSVNQSGFGSRFFAGRTLGKELRIRPNQPLSLNGDNRGRQIKSLGGNLWISQSGDPIDHILNTGEQFVVTRRGRIVVESFTESRMVIR